MSSWPGVRSEGRTPPPSRKEWTEGVREDYHDIDMIEGGLGRREEECGLNNGHGGGRRERRIDLAFIHSRLCPLKKNQVEDQYSCDVKL